MANPEHLAILKQGVEVWNKWREENPGIKPDLIGADLSESSDIGGSLPEVDFKNTDLDGACLIDTNLYRADFSEAHLRKANLGRASLISAIFYRADLSEANLRWADLSGADMTDARLVRTNFRDAYLNDSQLIKANLRESNLIGAQLIKAIFTGADITGTILYGTTRDEWVIDGIQCEHVYWDPAGKTRSPQNRNFRQGEFEALYKHLPSFIYYFEHGFTPVDAFVMDRIVQAINESHPEFELKLDSFHSRGQPHAVFTVHHKEVSEEALNQVKAGYEEQIKVLEGRREQLLEVIQILSNNPTKLQLIAGEIFIGGDKYEIQGQAGAIGPGAHAHDINFNQVWNDISKDIDLSKLLGELSILRDAIKREAKSSEQYHALAEVSDAETAAKAGNGSRVVEHLKNAGKWSLKVAQDIGTDVAAEVIKKSLGI
jgi:hypothetical protein